MSCEGPQLYHLASDAMPIRHLLDKTSFGPEDIKVLVSAFEDALRDLGVERTDAAATALAKRILALGQQGERDPVRLRERAVEGLNARRAG
jgi:hypothetical protein